MNDGGRMIVIVQQTKKMKNSITIQTTLTTISGHLEGVGSHKNTKWYIVCNKTYHYDINRHFFPCHPYIESTTALSDALR